MYLARGVLNAASRSVQRDLADPVNLHRTIMRWFPDALGESARKTVGVLHRVDRDQSRDEVVLFVQSLVEADFTKAPAGYFVNRTSGGDNSGTNPQVRAVAKERETISTGSDFFFRLRANATRKILTKTQSDGQRQNGKRV